MKTNISLPIFLFSRIFSTLAAPAGPHHPRRPRPPQTPPTPGIPPCYVAGTWGGQGALWGGVALAPGRAGRAPASPGLVGWGFSPPTGHRFAKHPAPSRCPTGKRSVRARGITACASLPLLSGLADGCTSRKYTAMCRAGRGFGADWRKSPARPPHRTATLRFA